MIALFADFPLVFAQEGAEWELLVELIVTFLPIFPLFTSCSSCPSSSRRRSGEP